MAGFVRKYVTRAYSPSSFPRGQSDPRDPKEDTTHCPLNPFKPVQQPQIASQPLVSISQPNTLEEVFGFTRGRAGFRILK